MVTDFGGLIEQLQLVDPATKAPRDVRSIHCLSANPKQQQQSKMEPTLAAVKGPTDDSVTEVDSA